MSQYQFVLGAGKIKSPLLLAQALALVENQAHPSAMSYCHKGGYGILSIECPKPIIEAEIQEKIAKL